MEDSRPPKRQPDEDREIDYLLCNQCTTPCYIFEMELGKVREAQCLVCGNDDPMLFGMGEEAGSDI